ncbi:ABC TRANSPORTER ATP-BINDING PROTEIN [Mycoplasmopsis pulmonis]|uniref:Energy-coupling factor transporter ATP-binding protein EcfA2 n=1 Tax=Mycoplasmopsis pulmonis (strain UAB CTIP) TaxID=272635 RepID=ECFA2_MYCPU|nr:energy-coupling factor transporter ATPase [Mycoplasmopsis pulmonis]Q98QH4.1 RecName: Full=Energy-coupling factor transporter ATP-binding protein EcfA2; Short=ECF transporter A component EcfA2 [Mycoplasmopsis pulmonis UAB CTIP]MDZ7293341.1 energy-coupling factor transporter ATPase [Mycoplasmopsis pulmonis]CAC13560.1 ABC TRANSPORTER ATP-BINDING PROTEIN [Mycoplasmopsis pulmonis]VEU68150.1 cobalt transporter ATP-binding subunit [Mycoplasmopsis pulmonis]
MQIIVKNISYIYNRKTALALKALDDSSCIINQGEHVAIIGSTGSGKTTFIEHLNALLIPETGTINWIFENEHKKTKEKYLEDVVLKRTYFKKVKKAKDIRRRIGVVFQFAEYQIFEETIEKDIMFGPRSYGVSKEEAKQRAAKYLEMVGLPLEFLEKNPFGLSGGQKRRVALAGILAIEPDFLVLDEPTAGLDPQGVKDILDIFDNINKNGKTVIMVTHDLDNVLERTKRTLVFDKGKLIRDAGTYEILKDEKFLVENKLKSPKLITFVNKLEQRGIFLKPVTSIDKLAIELNIYLRNKQQSNE